MCVFFFFGFESSPEPFLPSRASFVLFCLVLFGFFLGGTLCLTLIACDDRCRAIRDRLDVPKQEKSSTPWTNKKKAAIPPPLTQKKDPMKRNEQKKLYIALERDDDSSYAIGQKQNKPTNQPTNKENEKLMFFFCFAKKGSGASSRIRLDGAHERKKKGNGSQSKGKKTQKKTKKETNKQTNKRNKFKGVNMWMSRGAGRIFLGVFCVIFPPSIHF